MPKFHFIVAKTGCNPMKTKLLLFFNWGIKFGDAYSVPKKAVQKVHYAGKEDIMSKLFVSDSGKSSEQPHSGNGGIAQMQNMVANNMREVRRRECKEQQPK